VVCGLVLWAMLLSAANAGNTPVLKSYRQPVYPPIAKAVGMEGSVTLEFSLDQQGNVFSVSTLRGNPLLAKAAESFVKTWRFESGSPAASYRTTIRFKLLD
jgi:protein TonB